MLSVFLMNKDVYILHVKASVHQCRLFSALSIVKSTAIGQLENWTLMSWKQPGNESWRDRRDGFSVALKVFFQMISYRSTFYLLTNAHIPLDMFSRRRGSCQLVTDPTYYAETGAMD